MKRTRISCRESPKETIKALALEASKLDQVMQNKEVICPLHHTLLYRCSSSKHHNRIAAVGLQFFKKVQNRLLDALAGIPIYILRWMGENAKKWVKKLSLLNNIARFFPFLAHRGLCASAFPVRLRPFQPWVGDLNGKQCDKFRPHADCWSTLIAAWWYFRSGFFFSKWQVNNYLNNI